MSLHYDIFNVMNLISILLFISMLIGNHYLSNKLPMFTPLFQLYVGLLLVYKFNMFMPLDIKKKDQQIIYTAGTLLVVSQIINFSYLYDDIYNSFIHNDILNKIIY
jgi:hypothetical protein